MLYYDIAFKLGVPLYVVTDEMSNQEVDGWIEYLSRRPAGWEADQRAAMLMNAMGAKEKPHRLFNSLKRVKEDQERSKAKSNVAIGFMKRFGDRFPELNLEK
jgi:hypothetical protein